MIELRAIVVAKDRTTITLDERRIGTRGRTEWSMTLSASDLDLIARTIAVVMEFREGLLNPIEPEEGNLREALFAILDKLVPLASHLDPNLIHFAPSVQIDGVKHNTNRARLVAWLCRACHDEEHLGRR